eukprot:COSAG06_NODE_4119_length_4550_cov_2.137497_6_plen_67_part_01
MTARSFLRFTAGLCFMCEAGIESCGSRFGLRRSVLEFTVVTTPPPPQLYHQLPAMEPITNALCITED